MSLVGQIQAVLGRSEIATTIATSAGLVAIRVFGTVATFLYTLLMARMMPAEDVGLVWTIWSGTLIAANVANLNIGSGAVREVVKAREAGNLDLAAGFVRVSRRVLAVASPFVVAGVLLAAWWRSPETFAENQIAYVLAAASVPLLAWVQITAATATALNQTLRSLAPRDLIRPFLFLLAFCGLWLFAHRPSVTLVILLYMVSIAFAAISQYALIRRFIHEIQTPQPDVSRWREWIGLGLYMSPTILLTEHLKNIVILCAAIALAASDVGILAVTYSIINFLNFGVVAVDVAFSPRIASATAREEVLRAKRLLAASSALKTVPIIIASLLLIPLAQPVLSIFGETYEQGAGAMMWLLLLPLSRAVFGNSVLVLQMHGYRSQIFWSSLAGTLAVALSVAFLSQPYGLEGAAAFAGFSFALVQAVRCVICQKLTGIDTSVLGAGTVGLDFLRQRRAAK